MSVSFRLRPVKSLAGLWDFVFLGEVDPSRVTVMPPVNVETLPVPSAFDALPFRAGQRGVAVYQTTMDVPPNRRARLEFDAVSIWCRILIDGQPLKEHACGYAPFAVDLPPAPVEQRTLTVVVDNRFDFERAPMHEPFFDFYQYGGILRDVRLHLLPGEGPWIESVHVMPTDGYAEGEVEITVIPGEGASIASLTLQFDDAEPMLLPQVAPASQGSIRLVARVPQPGLWSPQSPQLHALRVVAHIADGTASDDIAVRFGLRRIEAHDGALWLNGEVLRIRGYNRHEWHPNYGPATPLIQMVADLQILRDMGCNFIRGGHYPQDQRFLDLCDEFGILFWEENLGWQNSEAAFTHPKFLRDQEESLRAMVKASFNHPCVIIWGFLNEVATDSAYVRPLMEKNAALLRALDPSRLISYASRLALTDLHFDLVDVIAVNLYPGWYECANEERPLDLIAPHFERCFASIDARGFKDKPIIVSETGAEAIYGFHDLQNDFFTEEYQAEYLTRAGNAALGNPRCSGIAYWHFSDFRASEKGRSLHRPRCFNNKGTFDEYRRPKAACHAVKTLFHHYRDELPVIAAPVVSSRSTSPLNDALASKLHENASRI